MLRRLSVVLVLVSGCATDEPDTSTNDLDLRSCLTTPVRVDRSLAVTDPTVLARFGFDRTFDALIATAGTNQTRTQLFQQWMRTFGPTDCPGVNPFTDPQGFGEVCPRGEQVLATHDPFTPGDIHFKPVGLFNRFDLAPSDGANCGEYRVIYAMDQGPGRAFFIFEAALPNPQPSLGLAGCAPIAQFWADRSRDATVQVTATALEKFYYGGGIVPGVGPVIDAHNYGFGQDHARFGAGQIRSDMLVDDTWQLREFKTDLRCASSRTCGLFLDHVTVKTNPANELFEGSHRLAPKFVDAFSRSVRALAAGDVSSIGMSIDDVFDEFESKSQTGTDTDYDLHTPSDSPLRTAIQHELAAMPSNTRLSARNILDRATTQTCAGCHEPPGGLNLGGGLVWPASLRFVHVDEQSNLSPALTDKFLPHRAEVLSNFVCGVHTDAVATLTVGGSPVGAAN